MKLLRRTIRQGLQAMGYQIQALPKAEPVVPNEFANIPDANLYCPTFSPWNGEEEFRRYYELARPRTLVSIERCYVLFSLARQAIHVSGHFWECGVYKGGTAALLAEILKDCGTEKRLYLFDTFEGMPETDAEVDLHKIGDFSDTTMESVAASIGAIDQCVFKKGLIPQTFLGLEDAKIAFAHIDVDIHQSIIDCLNFIWPRLSNGGFIVFDDYGFQSCPGARAAVDSFFKDKRAVPLCLQTGQCLVFNHV